MTQFPETDALTDALRSVLLEQTKEARDQMIRKCVLDFESELRSRVVDSVARVLDMHYEIRREESRLVIEVIDRRNP